MNSFNFSTVKDQISGFTGNFNLHGRDFSLHSHISIYTIEISVYILVISIYTTGISVYTVLISIYKVEISVYTHTDFNLHRNVQIDLHQWTSIYIQISIYIGNGLCKLK